MKHIRKSLILLFLIEICFLYSSIFTVNGWNFDEEIEKANEFLYIMYGYEDYFSHPSQSRNIIKKYITDGHSAFHGYPVMLYGTAKEATDSYFKGKGSSSPAGKYSNKNGEYRALGFTFEGCPFPNPWFPPDYEGNFTNNNDSILVPKVPVELNTERNDFGRYWIKNPYYLKEDNSDSRELSNKLPDVGNSIFINEATSKMINSWVRTDSFHPDKIPETAGDRAYYADLVVNPPVSIKDNLEDYIAVLSPPTDRSWGIAIGFYYIGSGSNIQSRYSLFYLMPTELATSQDILSAEFDSLPSKYADPGEIVAVGININSKSEEDLEGIDYKLEVTRVKDGKPIAKDIKGSNIDPDKQKIDIPKNRGNSFYVCLDMPEDSGVDIKFAINEDGTNPVETYLYNNKIETTIKIPLPPTIQEFDLDYNILSRKITYPLYKDPIKATLELPSGYSWNGNATGSLNVANEAKDLLRDFEVTNNPKVNEASTTITREPQIHATLLRPDFGDDPKNKKWSDWNDPNTMYVPISLIQHFLISVVHFQH